MLTLLLAHLLSLPATAQAAYATTVYLETTHEARVERHAKAEELGRWLDGLDGVRIRALSRYSPFADSPEPVSPFEGQP